MSPVRLPAPLEDFDGMRVRLATPADAEQWARKHGCGAVRLHSNVLRPRAHAFYEGLGYRVTKLQKAFRKYLT
jgi:GNAT superfamily N-acetyltransferase